MKLGLTGRTALVTGGSAGIGKAAALALAQEGATVVIASRSQENLDTARDEISSFSGCSVQTVVCDVSDLTALHNLIGEITDQNGGLDVLINNAHFIPRTHSKRDAKFEDYPLDLWDNTIAINLRGLFLCCQEIGKVMLTQKKGVIINVSSIYGIIGADQRIYGESRLNSPAFYAATKGAMVNLTKHLAAYWQGKNIRVNTLTLGGVFDEVLHQDKKFIKNYSKKTILGRMANKEDYDGPLLFLSSNASSYMTGANLIIDGGWTAW